MNHLTSDTGRVDYVVTSALLGGENAAEVDAAAAGYDSYWDRLERVGTTVIAISDAPRPGGEEPRYKCVERHPDDHLKCAFPANDGVGSEALRRAVDLGRARAWLDLDPWVCPPTPDDRCPAVVGKVLVYRQGTHLTRTFVESMTRVLESRLVAAGILDRRSPQTGRPSCALTTLTNAASVGNADNADNADALPMIGRMRHAPRTLRAPPGHRVVAALASPLVGYLIARLVLELASLPALPIYAVCLTVAAVLGYRAWAARIDLSRNDVMRVHNTLVSQSISRESVHRVADNGRIEWRRGRDRPTRSLSETLRPPWWAFGTAATTYARNREELRSWVRTAGRRPDGQSAA